MLQNKLGPKGTSDLRDEVRPLDQHYLIELSAIMRMFHMHCL